MGRFEGVSVKNFDSRLAHLEVKIAIGEADLGLCSRGQGFAWSWYLSQTCNLQAEFVCLDWADKM